MADEDVSFYLPMGVDYADGVTPIPINPVGASGSGQVIGTPDPANQKKQYDNGTWNQRIQEEDGSPETERAEQCTNVHSQIMPTNLAYSFLSGLGRGTFVRDSSLVNLFRILSAKVTRIGKSAPGFSRLTTVAESISFDTPPDDFWVETVDLGVNIIKNPRYFTNLYPTTENTLFQINDFTTMVGSADDPTNKGVASVAQVKMAIIRMIQTYQDAPFFPSFNTTVNQSQVDIISSITSNVVSTLVASAILSVDITKGDPDGSAACVLAAAAAGEIIQNIWYQNDTPFIPGFEINWVQHTFYSPYLDPGCYIQDPLTVLPDYFSNPESTQQKVPNTGNIGTETPSAIDSPSIFDAFVDINPQYFSSNGMNSENGGTVQYSALRKPDVSRFNRTWFDLTHSWLVSPIGHWNPYIYSNRPRPTNPSDYQPLA